jgi:hypothetical protein
MEESIAENSSVDPRGGRFKQLVKGEDDSPGCCNGTSLRLRQRADAGGGQVVRWNLSAVKGRRLPTSL